MQGMLIMEPAERLTALGCLAHEYFDDIRDAEVEELIKNHKAQTNGNSRREGSKPRSCIREGIERK